jgi:thiol:disulfide interchange protein
MALLLPFLLGVGMALPWPFAGAGLAFLPKPGMWMVRVKQAFGVFILLFAAFYAYKTWVIVAPREDMKLEEGWVASLEEGFTQAQEEGKPVLIDFWATWCTNCYVMEKSTLKDETVQERLDGYVKIKYQAETTADPVTKAVMEHYEVKGLPLYLILHEKTDQ